MAEEKPRGALSRVASNLHKRFIAFARKGVQPAQSVISLDTRYSPEELGIKIDDVQYITVFDGQERPEYRAARLQKATKGTWQIQRWCDEAEDYVPNTDGADNPEGDRLYHTKDMFDRLAVLEADVCPMDEDILKPGQDHPAEHYSHDSAVFREARKDKVSKAGPKPGDAAAKRMSAGQFDKDKIGMDKVVKRSQRPPQSARPLAPGADKKGA